MKILKNLMARTRKRRIRVIFIHFYASKFGKSANFTLLIKKFNLGFKRRRISAEFDSVEKMNKFYTKHLFAYRVGVLSV